MADSISVWNNNIFIGSGLDLLCISSSGNLLWKYRIGEEIRTAPAIGSDGTIYVRGRISYLVAISQSGTLKWSLNLGSDISHTYMSPVISPNGIIYTYGLVNKYYPEYGGSYEYTVLYGIEVYVQPSLTVTVGVLSEFVVPFPVNVSDSRTFEP